MLEHAWRAEQRRTANRGWVAQLLALQGKDGNWPEGRWTDSLWTLLLLMALGLPEDHAAAPAPLALLRSTQRPNGRWPLQSRIPGTLLVEMERPGGESRWNTLRALRILRTVDGVGAEVQRTGWGVPAL